MSEAPTAPARPGEDVAPPTLLVLQHEAIEPPAAYEDELRELGVPFHRVVLDAGDALPDWRGYAGIVAMGGPMGAYEDDLHAWLTAEKALVAEAVAAGVPFWGACLGAQVLAAALGASVHPGPAPELGVLPITTTAAAAQDPVFRHAPARFRALQWHGDTFDLPAGATLLASSAAYPHQAFVRGRAYGVQFHLEATGELVRDWTAVPEYAAEVDRALGPAGVGSLHAEVDAAEPDTYPLARALFGAWLVEVVGVRGAATPRADAAAAAGAG